MLYGAVTLLLANLAAVALTPRAIHKGYGIFEDPSIIGAWRGTMTDKNAAGLLTAVTILMLIFGVRRFRLVVRAALIVCATVFLIGTHSKTSLGVTATTMVGGFLFARVPALASLASHRSSPRSPRSSILSSKSCRRSSSRWPRPRRVHGTSRNLACTISVYQEPFWFGAGYQSFWNIRITRQSTTTPMRLGS